MTLDDLKWHEAGHCAMALLLVVPVLAVSVEPDEKSLGRVWHATDHSTTNGAVKHMRVILGGLVVTRRAAELWWDGLDPERSTDERNLYELAKALNMDERRYNDIVLNALKLSTSDEFNHLVTTITACLDFWPVLDHRHLEVL